MDTHLDIERDRVEKALPRDMPVGDDLPLKIYLRFWKINIGEKKYNYKLSKNDLETKIL